jgi:hypothetical protein
MEGAKTKFIGEAINRIDGVLKVTGAANYATDWPIRNIAHRFGGSHAQRDLLDLTLIEASFRSGNAALAAALAAERAAMRPHSPLAQLFVRRSMRLADAA